MRYSPKPHVAYLQDGKGPGALFLGDLERWNWRWLVRGEAIDVDFDQALVAYFNDSQRRIMQMEPTSALEFLVKHLPTVVTAEVRSRAEQAQAWLDSPSLESDGNVVFAKFGR